MTAQEIAQAMIADGITSTMANGLSEDQKVEFVLAYMEAQSKKIEKMQTKYKTCDDFRTNFQKLVFELCK